VHHGEKFVWHIDQTSRIWVTEFFQQDYEDKYFASLVFNVLLSLVLVFLVIFIAIKNRKEKREFVLLNEDDIEEDEKF
jgi:hypothetical protein